MQSHTLIKDIKDTISSPQGSRIGSGRERFLINVSSNVALTASQAIVTLWLTPFLIGHLGIAAYGLVPLANSLISYMAVFTNALNSAVSRFLAIDLEQGDRLAANKTFNTALFGTVGIVVALSPLALGLSLAFANIFNVPPGWERDAGWLFSLAAAGFFITVIASNFAVSPFIHSRFLTSNAVQFGALAIRVALMIILFSQFSAHLWYVGGGLLAGALVSFLGYILLWNNLTPELNIQVTAFDRSRLRPLAKMGGWSIVHMMGAMLLSRIDLIIVNAYFGATATGGYGTVIQFQILIEYLVYAISNVVRPTILIKYAQRDFLGLQHLSFQAVKLLGLTLALPIGLLCGFSRPLLSVWLGSSFQNLSLLLILVVAHLGINLSVQPVAFIQNAYNKIRWPGIVTLISGGANLGLAIVLAQWGGWGYAGVAVATLVVWTARNALYMPIYTAHIMELPWWFFLPSLTAGVVGTFFVGAVAYGITLVGMPDSWFTLASSAAGICLLYTVSVWVIGLNRSDRQLLKSFLPKYLKKRPFI